MSIPLDQLYNYIDDIATDIFGEPIVIYRFFPHGSKKLEDVLEIKWYTWQEVNLLPNIFCHDQEPLNFDYYKNYKYISKKQNPFADIVKSSHFIQIANNLRKKPNIYDQAILLHSEQRSQEVERYKQNRFITVYYWNHALLALDWFRYADHVTVKKNPVKKFLIYNRAWAGTREYRLKFADLLVQAGLPNECVTSVALDGYQQHQFANPAWQPICELENYFQNNTTPSTFSADFSVEDYVATDIEVVLETLFDDGRLHLTEKALRPIAMSQPFILAATHGSLEYLRRYGFKTFDSIWDESYDQIKDPPERLKAVVDLMKTISEWDAETRISKLHQAKLIADYNKQHFFSKDFLDKIITELKDNLKTAVDEFNSTKSSNIWVDWWNTALLHPPIQEFLASNTNTKMPTQTQFDIVYKQAKNLLTSP
jgi:hypothetical protein